jgi:hypothetical protein
MNVIEVTERIKAIPLFKDLVLNEPTDSSQYGTIKVPTNHFKDKNKNEIRLTSFYSLFVAHMYKERTDMEEFFYLTFYHAGTQSDYRRRTWYGIEYNKIFVSGKTVDEIISQLENKLIDYQLL